MKVKATTDVSWAYGSGDTREMKKGETAAVGKDLTAAEAEMLVACGFAEYATSATTTAKTKE